MYGGTQYFLEEAGIIQSGIGKFLFVQDLGINNTWIWGLLVGNLAENLVGIQKFIQKIFKGFFSLASIFVMHSLNFFAKLK